MSTTNVSWYLNVLGLKVWKLLWTVKAPQHTVYHRTKRTYAGIQNESILSVLAPLYLQFWDKYVQNTFSWQQFLRRFVSSLPPSHVQKKHPLVNGMFRRNVYCSFYVGFIPLYYFLLFVTTLFQRTQDLSLS